MRKKQMEAEEKGGWFDHLSALSAVSVNTDTPTEVSWITGMSLHAASPNTHSSEKYRKASTGMHVTSSSRSPTARLEMKMLGTLLIALFVIKIFTSVMFPSRPTVMITMYTEVMTQRTTKCTVSPPSEFAHQSGSSVELGFRASGSSGRPSGKLERNSSSISAERGAGKSREERGCAARSAVRAQRRKERGSYSEKSCRECDFISHPLSL